MGTDQESCTQRWYCPTCEKTGAVKYNNPAEVMSVIYSIRTDHGKVSPECGAPVGRLQVLNEKGLGAMEPEEKAEILRKFNIN